MSRRHMTRMDFTSFKIWSNMASESTSTNSEGRVFQDFEGVVY